jgi:hypothetical protein
MFHDEGTHDVARESGKARSEREVQRYAQSAAFGRDAARNEAATITNI